MSVWVRWRLVVWPAAVFAFLVGFYLWVAQYRAAAEYQILPDDRGRITHVVCVVNSARRAVLRNAPLVTRILKALPKRTRVTVLTNDPQAFVILGDPQRGRLEFLDLPAKSDFTIWPQDPFVVLERRDGNRVLLVSREFDRVDDRLIPHRLAKRWRLTCRKSKLIFEGGNIVPGSRHVFIGANTIRYNAIKLRKTDVEIVKAFQREFGKPVLVVGPLPQPVEHIDMMLTVVGDNRIGLADPRWGAKIALRELKERPDRVRKFEKHCEEFFFGNPHIHSLRNLRGEQIKPPSILGETAKAIKDSENIAPHLDRVEVELRRYGYVVRRFPFLMRLRQPELRRLPGNKNSSDELEFGPGYPCLTYDNVLVENEPGRRTVYLPQYGFDALDRAAVSAWRKAGCRVVPVQGLAISAMYGGSLRCCAKVIQRD